MIITRGYGDGSSLVVTRGFGTYIPQIIAAKIIFVREVITRVFTREVVQRVYPRTKTEIK